MGARHATAVFETWAGVVKDPALVLLIHMALTAKDSDDEPVYYGGHEKKARAIGRRDVDSEATRQTIERRVAQLTKAGALVPVGKPGPGAPPVYKVATTRPDGPPNTPQNVRGDKAGTPLKTRGVFGRSAERTPLKTRGEHPSFREVNTPHEMRSIGVMRNKEEENPSALPRSVSSPGAARTFDENPDEDSPTQTSYRTDVTDADALRYVTVEAGDDGRGLTGTIQHLAASREEPGCTMHGNRRLRDQVARAREIPTRAGMDPFSRAHVIPTMHQTHHAECHAHDEADERRPA